MIPLALVGGFAKAEGFKVRRRFTEYVNGAYYENKIKAMHRKKIKTNHVYLKYNTSNLSLN